MEGRPRLLLAYVNSVHAANCGRYFRRLGWEVRLVASGVEARRQIAGFQPNYIVVDLELPDETGWLTCAKIMLDQPKAGVIVLAPTRSSENLERMQFVGLDALVTRAEGVEGLADVILGKRMTQAVG